VELRSSTVRGRVASAMTRQGKEGQRVDTYLRVYTSERTTDNQRRELIAVAKRHGWIVVRVRGRRGYPFPGEGPESWGASAQCCE
jgi:hypothetical protein